MVLMSPAGDGLGTDVDDDLPPAALADVSLLLQVDAETVNRWKRWRGSADFASLARSRGENAAVANGVPTLNDKGPLLFAVCGESRKREVGQSASRLRGH